MNNTIPQQKTIKDIEFGYYFKHYISLLLRWKWFILLVGPIVGLCVGLLLYKVIVKAPALGTRAIIGIEEPVYSNVANNQSSVWDIGSNCVELIKSKSFLTKIIDTLNLQFIIPNFKRGDIFSAISMNSNFLTGSYKFIVNTENDSYQLVYINGSKKLFHSTKELEQVLVYGKLSELNRLEFTGVNLMFSDNFTSAPFSFDFNIVPKKYILRDMSHSLIVEPPDRRAGKKIITIRSFGTDYQLVTDIVNNVVDHYIALNFILKKRKLESTLQQLEIQLSQIKRQMYSSEKELSLFRAKNPTVGLSSNSQYDYNSLLDLEDANDNTKETVSYSRKLLLQLKRKENPIQTTREALVFLISQNNIAAGILRDELDVLERQRDELRQTYGNEHPLRIENNEKIKNIQDETVVNLLKFNKEITKRYEAQNTKKIQLTKNLKSAPEKELQLAKLIRKQDINADLYSEIMVSYNTAKVAYAGLVPRFYVLDYASSPIEPGRFMKLLQLLVIMVVVGLVFSIGPPFFLDLIDKRVWNGKQLSQTLKLPVLESIPLMSIEKKNSKDKINNTLISPFLERHIVPFYSKEIFKSLHTKVLYSMDSSQEKILAVTSLESGDGKSIISSNLALALSVSKKRVLLIDSDIRRGTIHDNFKVKNDIGLSDLFVSDLDDDYDKFGQYIKATAIPNLFLLTRGSIVGALEDILNPKVKGLLKNICNTYFDFTIIDTAPIGAVTDSLMIDDIISKYLIVAYAGKTNGFKLKKRIEEFELLKGKIVGTVINASSEEAKSKYEEYGSYYKDIT